MAAHPDCDALVSTDWVRERLDEIRDPAPDVRAVEVDLDTSSYAMNHIPGAVGWDWETDLCDGRRRDLASPADFERLLGESGIGEDTTVVLYGDNNNWFAAYAFWQLEYMGHEDVLLMNGGRKKWALEDGAFTQAEPEVEPQTYSAAEPDESIRAYRPDIEAIVESGDVPMIDVRSPEEFTGEVIAPPEMDETAQRGGHIPGATNVPWASAVEEDGTFKSLAALREIYERETGIDPGEPVVTYCRIGERSSHTWFVLTYLLGHEDVRNYDGSWTEWGNLIGAPIETGE